MGRALAEIDLEHRAFFRLGMKERGAPGETQARPRRHAAQLEAQIARLVPTSFGTCTGRLPQSDATVSTDLVALHEALAGGSEALAIPAATGYRDHAGGQQRPEWIAE